MPDIGGFVAIPPSYYDQIGGAQVRPDIVKQFSAIVLDDPDLQPYLGGVDIARRQSAIAAGSA
jgi:hemoglobin